MNDVIRIAGLRARGHHGVFDHERVEGQDFVVDVAVELDTRAAAGSDDLDRTVHYGVLAEQVVAEVERDPVDLIETLAERIAVAVLRHRAVLAATVTVHKPQAPITVPFDDVSITITRTRVDVLTEIDVAPAPDATTTTPTAIRADTTATAVPPARRRDAARRRRDRVRRPERGRVSRAVVALGANLGDRGSTLRAAAAELVAVPGVRPVSSSHEVESAAVTLDGVDADLPRYRNAVVVVDTDLSPTALLAALHELEDRHGRTREVRWGDRTLDLDLVAYDDDVIDTEALTVPHPRAGDRAFVLAPWLDADPDAVLPGRGAVAALLAAVGDDTVRVDEPRLFRGAHA